MTRKERREEMIRKKGEIGIKRLLERNKKKRTKKPVNEKKVNRLKALLGKKKREL